MALKDNHNVWLFLLSLIISVMETHSKTNTSNMFMLGLLEYVIVI